MFNFLFIRKKDLNGFSRSWDFMLDIILECGTILSINNSTNFIYGMVIKYNDYIYHIEIDPHTKNIFLKLRTSEKNGVHEIGSYDTIISIETYKTFLLLMPRILKKFNNMQEKRMFKYFFKENLTGVSLLWDNKLNELLDNGKLINIDCDKVYIWSVEIQYNDYLYYIKNDIVNKNIILVYRKSATDSDKIMEGYSNTLISRKTYKKFFKKINKMYENYKNEKYKEVYH